MALRLPLGSSSINYIGSTHNSPNPLSCASRGDLENHAIAECLSVPVPFFEALVTIDESAGKGRGCKGDRGRRRKEGKVPPTPAVVMALMTAWLKGNSRINSDSRNERASRTSKRRRRCSLCILMYPPRRLFFVHRHRW